MITKTETGPAEEAEPNQSKAAASGTVQPGNQVEMTNDSPACPVFLPRTATWEEWEQGRAARRALSRIITGGKPLRRVVGNPRKDKVLRALNNGERGMPFQL